MVNTAGLICTSEALQEGGDGIRFDWEGPQGRCPAFVVRHAGVPRAYVNRCAHIAVELDLVAGQFFDLTGHYLVCAMHGAHYEAASGVCELGPCKGARLEPVPVEERDGGVYWLPALSVTA